MRCVLFLQAGVRNSFVVSVLCWLDRDFIEMPKNQVSPKAFHTSIISPKESAANPSLKTRATCMRTANYFNMSNNNNEKQKATLLL